MKPLKKISFAVWLALYTSTAYSADPILDKIQFNKSDSVLSDQIFYQIGGGVGYMKPPTRAKSLKAVEFGIGWKANLMCGNFDIKTTVKNQLNGITEGFKDLMGNVVESAKGAVASMPAMIIQRANPQLYDLLTNGVYQGRIDFNRLKTSCEAMSKQLADYTLNGRWSKSADLENYKDIVAAEPDAKKAQKKAEDNKGKKGKEWVGGQKKGGENQKPIKLIEDVAKAGYNLLNNRNALDEKTIASKDCDGATCQQFDSPQKVSDFLTRIIGEQSISTCSEDCGPKTSSKAGVGLAPEIEEENVRTVEKLEQALNMDTPTPQLLAELSSNTIPVTRGLIETLNIPTVNNVSAYKPTYGSNGQGGTYNTGHYGSIAPINGSSVEQASGLLKKFEGFSSKTYWDVNAHRAGYGSDTITKADGTVIKIREGMTVSREDAERDLARRTREFANTARKNVSAETWDKLPPNAQAALTSIAYNYGSLSKLKSVVDAAKSSAASGDMSALANAVRRLQHHNNGVNAKRRNQEADYIMNKTG